MRGRLIAMVALLVLVAGCGGGTSDLVYPPDKISFAATDDGWRLGLLHFPPTGEPLDTEPLVLCHGIITTSITYYQGDRYGLAPVLAALGYDVWLVNLRGRYPSDRPAANPEKNFGWTIDDYINHDLPAVLAHVLEKTGAKRVTWIGHSMGGMIVYAYQGTRDDARIARIIAIASPIRFADYCDELKDLARGLGRKFDRDSALRLRIAGRFYQPFSEHRLFENYLLLVANLDNIDPVLWKRFVSDGVSDVSGGVLQHISACALDDSFKSFDGAIDYRRAMSNIQEPMLLLAGSVDKLGPATAVKPALDLVGSQDKTYREFGRANGQSVEYGHLDLVIGDHARREVDPVIIEWLRSHR
ncbi:MAG TPA: alpha/beta fold hydrolase [bacterium]|nr:alpha/beta fold hydrolase [bacterium]